MFFIFSLSVSAQQPLEVSGKVLDSLSTPMDNAIVLLLKGNKKQLEKTTFTEQNGTFSFSVSNVDTFYVSVNQLGYQNYISEPYIFSSSNNDIKLQDIVLRFSNNKLSEVTIVSSVPLIERKLDKSILNPDALISAAGLTAWELLSKAPGVITEDNGVVKLKGRSGTAVFVDDKPTYLSGVDLESYLKSIAASQVKQIEVITNPSAKYDASGSGGIINIVLKKNKTKGVNGSFSTNYGQGRYPKSSNSFNLNLNGKKVSFFSSIGNNYQSFFQDLNIYRRYKNPDLSTKSLFNQNTYIKVNNQSYNARLGLDYYINKSTTLGVSLKSLMNFSQISKYNKAELLDSSEIISNYVYADNSENLKFNNLTANVNVRHQFDSLGKQLSADIDYVTYSTYSDQIFLNDVKLPDATVVYQDKQNGKLPSQIDIAALKIDYENPLKNSAKLDLGFKSSYTKTDNEAIYTITQNDVTQDNYNLSNHFKYNEMINSLYGNVTKSYSKIDIQAGLRFESTILNGYQLGNLLKPSSTFNRTYHNLFPTLYLSYKLDSLSNNVLILSYGKRVNRPFYKDLNPFVRPLDKYTYYAGNPYVQPTFSHNVSLSHSYKNYITTSVSYSNIVDNIQETIEINNGVYYARPGNIGSSEQYNLSIESAIPFAKWLSTSIYSELVYSHFKSKLYNQTLDATGTYWFINATNSFNFKKGWSAEISGQYISDFIDSQFSFGDYGFINLGLQKKVLKDKGNLKFSLTDVMYTNTIRGRINNLDLTDARWKSLLDTRVASITFNYRFGKNTITKPRHNSNGSESEQNRVKT